MSTPDPTDAPLDPSASDGRPAGQSEDLRLGLWTALRAEKPGPPPPHPQPVKRSERGAWLPGTDLRGWATLADRIGEGWAMTETHAVGWEISALGRRGKLVETIAVRVRHAATGANAVAMLRRPLSEEDFSPEHDADGAPQRYAFKATHSICWVECRDPQCSMPPGHPVGVPRPLGARVFTAALKTSPPLTEDGLAWDVAPSTDEEE